LSEIDLGFAHTVSKNGTVLIRHHGKLATTLRGEKALAFAKKVASLTGAQQQQFMARLTGNYKRGNERLAKNHLKNRTRYG
jgi:hypothetical protein